MKVKAIAELQFLRKSALCAQFVEDQLMRAVDARRCRAPKGGTMNMLRLLLILIFTASGNNSVMAGGCDPSQGVQLNSNAPVVIAQSTNARAGQPIEFYWSRGSTSLHSHSSETLTVEVADTIRFDSGSLVVVRSDKAGMVKARANLSEQRGVTSGKFSITPFVAGRLSVTWTIQQMLPCGPTNYSGVIWFSVGIGPPSLADENAEPLSSATTLDGRYALETNDEGFRVVEVTTNETVLARRGNNPRFSPTGRFLIWQNIDLEEINIYDLLAGLNIFSGSGLVVGSADNDSFFLIEPFGAGLNIVRTLQDEEAEVIADDENEISAADTDPAVDGFDPYSFEDDVLFHSDPRKQIGPPIRPMYVQPLELFEGSDGYSGMPRQISLDADNDVLVYQEKRRDLDGGMVVYKLSTARKQYLDQENLDTYSLKQFSKDRMEYTTGWTTSENIQVFWAEDSEVETIQTSVNLDKKLALQINRQAEGVKRALRIGGKPAIRKLTDVVKEIDTNLTVAENRRLAPLNLVGNDKLALQIERELRPAYQMRSPLFSVAGEFSYDTTPIPDPKSQEEQESPVDLTRAGQFLWSWTSDERKFWLHQTVIAGRRGAGTSFALLATDPAKTLYTTFDDFGSGMLGDFRGELEDAVERSDVALAGKLLVVLTRPVSSLMLFDLESWKPVCRLNDLIENSEIISVHVVANGKGVLVEMAGETFAIYDCANGRSLATGRFVNGELVAVSWSGHFIGTVEATEYLRVRAAGLTQPLYLGQFASKLYREKMLSELFTPYLVPQVLDAPPQIESIQRESEQSFRLRISSTAQLTTLLAIREGRIVQRYGLYGRDISFDLSPDEELRGRMKLIAVDENGLASPPVELMIGDRDLNIKPVLYGVSWGVDKYSDDGLPDLTFAVSDAKLVQKSLKRAVGYASRKLTLVAQSATPADVLKTIDKVLSMAQPEDTVVLSFAGHGLVLEDSTLGIAAAMTQISNLPATTLRWSSVSSLLKKSKARIVVLLDVCHAGLSDPGLISTNDRAVERLINEGGNSIIIFSASKGRQFSEESASRAGGQFSVAFSEAVSRKRNDHDIDGNGRISASELGHALKSVVSEATNRRQTPWIARSELVGDFDLF